MSKKNEGNTPPKESSKKPDKSFSERAKHGSPSSGVFEKYHTRPGESGIHPYFKKDPISKIRRSSGDDD